MEAALVLGFGDRQKIMHGMNNWNTRYEKWIIGIKILELPHFQKTIAPVLT